MRKRGSFIRIWDHAISGIANERGYCSSSSPWLDDIAGTRVSTRENQVVAPPVWNLRYFPGFLRREWGKSSQKPATPAKTEVAGRGSELNEHRLFRRYI